MRRLNFLTISLAFVSILSLIVVPPLMKSSQSVFAQQSGGDKKPNFLVIMGDDFGFSDLGSFGSEISTPYLDALAKEGKIFTNYHAAPTCSPSRVALMTGVDWHIGGIGTMYELIAPNQVGKPGYETYINDKVVTVAELLRDAGYNTMQSGKWHLSGHGHQPGTTPWDRGFTNAITLLEDGSNHFNNLPYVPGWSVTFTKNATDAPRPENGTFDSTMYANQLLDFFKKTESEKKPFFAYLAFQVAHSPFMSPPELVDKYDKIYSVGWDKIREQRFEKQKELGFWPSNMTDPGRIPPNQVWNSLTNDQKAYAARVMAVHAGGIEQMDKDIGRVIKYLKDTGQYDNTFIMFTSDNGSSEPVEITDFQYASGVNLTNAKQFVAGINNSLSNLGSPTSDINYGAWGTYLAVSPLSGFKTSMYEGGIRPPLVIKAPQSMQSTSNNTGSNIINSFVYVTDFTPTILEMAGVSHPSTYKGHDVHAMMGTSIKPILEGTTDMVHPANETIPAEMFNTTVVRMGEWKGIHQASDKSGVWHLYNLATDLGENTDVGTQHPDILKKLIAAYDKYVQDVGVVPPTSGAFGTLFPPITANNTQTINLAKMLAPGYPLNETGSGTSIIN